MNARGIGGLLLGAAVIGVGVYAYRELKKLGDAAGKVADAGKAAYDSTVQRTSDVLTKLFGPELSQAAQETTYFVVMFDATGSQHAIPASSVNNQGQFIYADPPQTSRTYQLYKDAAGKKHARSA